MRTRSARRALAAGTALAAAAAATLLAAAPASAATGLDPATEIASGEYTFEFSPASGQWPASGAVPGLEFRISVGCPTGTTQTRHLILDEDGSAFPAAQSIGELPKDLWSAIGATDSAYATVGFSDAVLDGGAVATLKASPGTYTYVVACDSTQRFVSQPVGDSPYFQGTLTVTATGWSFEHIAPGSGEPEKTATETTLTVPSLQSNGATLTATVSGDPTGGTVQFTQDGANIGDPVAVSGGRATYAASGLAPQTQYSFGAVYSGDDTHEGSSSDPVVVTTPAESTNPGEPGGDSSDSDVNVDVPGSAETPATGLTIRVKPGSANLTGSVTRGEGVWEATGALGQVTVRDDRRDASAGGWTLNGEATDFSQQGTDATGSIAASNLGWAPSKIGGQGAAGSAVAPGTDGGLGTPKPLATGTASADGNVETTVEAELTLRVPADAPAGSYRSVLTLTLI
jgi:hypothetical protein